MANEYDRESNESEEVASVEVVNDPDAPVIYASTVRVWNSVSEFALALGRLEAPLRGSSKLALKQVGTVFMSPSHVKSVAELLTRKVAEYEAAYGTIPLGSKIESSESDA